MSEERDQPVAEEELVSTEEAGVADEAAAQGDETSETDDDGNPLEGDAEDDETEEVEHEGNKYKIPKALKPALLMQADYTRKTQEVAEERRALTVRATEIAQQAEAQATTLEERATLKAVESQLAEWQAINWQQYTQQYGSDAAVAAMGLVRQLEAAQAQLKDQITKKEADHRSQSEQATANALREAVAQLSKDIPGFGPETDIAVTKTAADQGFSPTELRDSLVGIDGKPDVRSYRVLAELTRLREFEAKHKATTTKAQTAQKQAAVQPAKTVRPNSGAYKPGLNDDLPADEWLRRRNAELAKKRG